jgi:ferredoxin-NADP reductase
MVLFWEVSDERDFYAASPSPMLRSLGYQLDRWGLARDRVHLDSFSV